MTPEPNHPPASPPVEPADEHGMGERPRFCPACGARLAYASMSCSVCASRSGKERPSPIAHTSAPLRHALALYFVLLGILLGMMIAGKFIDDAPNDRVRLEIVVSIGLSLVVSVASLLASRHLRSAMTSAGPRRYVLVAPVISLVTFGAASLLVRLVQSLFQTEAAAYSTDYLEAGWSWGMILVIVAVQPAIFEELAFRGIIGASLERVLEPREALIVTALLFAGLHLNPLMFPHLFLMGLGLGYLRRASGSLYPCMILHFCHNSLVVLSEYLRG